MLLCMAAAVGAAEGMDAANEHVHTLGPERIVVKGILGRDCVIEQHVLKTCTECGEVVTVEVRTRGEHDQTKLFWVTLREPTFTKEGEEGYKCQKCGKILETRAMPPYGSKKKTNADLTPAIKINGYASGKDGAFGIETGMRYTGDFPTKECWYRFETTRVGEYIFSVENISGTGNIWVTVYTDDRRLVFRSDDAQQGKRVSGTAMIAGGKTYYVVIRSDASIAQHAIAVCGVDTHVEMGADGKCLCCGRMTTAEQATAVCTEEAESGHEHVPGRWFVTSEQENGSQRKRVCHVCGEFVETETPDRQIQADYDSPEHFKTHERGAIFTCNANKVKIRYAPNKNQSYGRLIKGQEFYIIELQDAPGDKNDWVKIKVAGYLAENKETHGGMTGWIPAKYVDCSCKK